MISSPPITTILLLLLPLATAASALNSTPLVTNFCKKTSMPPECEYSLGLDPATSRAKDPFTLAAIAVRQSYLNATETRNFIAGLMKGGGGGGRVGMRRLRACESRYSLALGMVANMDGDINDDNYSNLAYEAREAKAYVDKCEAQWRNATWQPMGIRNMVVGVLFEVVFAIGTSVAGPP
ncbi:hypothetical protein LINGRAHAP2_LOCUS16715 [Linum grandiflorum]